MESTLLHLTLPATCSYGDRPQAGQGEDTNGKAESAARLLQKDQRPGNHAPIERPLYMYTGQKAPPGILVHRRAHPT
jgi:hypothetical protein